MRPLSIPPQAGAPWDINPAVSGLGADSQTTTHRKRAKSSTRSGRRHDFTRLRLPGGTGSTYEVSTRSRIATDN